jgi:hypothetical protein
MPELRTLNASMPIPQDLRDFLTKPETRHMSLKEGEVRELTLFSAEELKLEKFVVDSCELHVNGPLEVDPGEQREYEGYSLIKECNNYDPNGVLTWFPGFNAYGSADTEHQRIIIYPGVTWTDILRAPTWYVNGEWYPDRVSQKRGQPIAWCAVSPENEPCYGLTPSTGYQPAVGIYFLFCLLT